MIMFVAAPTKVDDAASYKSVAAMRENFYEPICKRLEAALACKIDLHIEADKKKSGPIHDSMFSAAADSDIYLADITGSNPNVFLELGARWALRDYVTVLVAQDGTPAPFNVSAVRRAPYHHSTINADIERVVSFVLEGLNEKHIDSPIRDHKTFLTISRDELQALRDELSRLQNARGEEYFSMAVAKDNGVKKPAVTRVELLTNTPTLYLTG